MNAHALARTSLLFLFVSSTALLGGCGSESSDDSTGGSGASGAAGPSGSTGASGGAGPGSGGSGGGGVDPCDADCPDLPENPGSGQTLAMGLVSGTVLDLSGSPVSMSQVQLCGINLCLFGTTDGSGVASVDGGGQMLERPAFKYGDALKQGRFAVPLDMVSGDLGDLVTAELPASGAPMTAGAEAVSGPVTLSIEAGGSVEIDCLAYGEPDQQGFRAAEVPAAQVPAVVGLPAGIEQVYVVSPIETVFCPPAQVTVPNDAGFAAGAAVEFWAHGLDIAEHIVPYGGWARFSDGVVSEDGNTISTSPEQGMELLTTFGVKLK
jgi:hypothetical protein